MNDKGTKSAARFLSLLLAAALLLVLCACGKKGEPASPTAAPAKGTAAPAGTPTFAPADTPTSVPAGTPTSAPASGFDYGNLGHPAFSIEELDVREDIRSAILASKRLSGGSLLLASDGSLIYWGGKRHCAYAYYGEPVAGL